MIVGEIGIADIPFSFVFVENLHETPIWGGKVP